MQARHEESRDREQADDGVADKGHVEVAGSSTVRIEGRAVLPARAGHRAPPQHDAGAIGNLLADHANEILEALDAAAERQPDDVVALLSVAQTALILFHAPPFV